MLWWLGFSFKGIGLYDYGDKIKFRKVILVILLESIIY